MTELQMIHELAATLKLQTETLTNLKTIAEEYETVLKNFAERIAALERQVPEKLEPGGSALPL